MSVKDLRYSILDYMLTVESPVSIRQIAKAIREADSTVEYQVQKFVEKQVLLVVDPLPSRTIRVYGKKYVVNPVYRRDQSRTTALLLLAVMSTVSGLLLILTRPLLASIVLAPSALTGLAFTIRERRREHVNTIQTLLET